jgi:two-component system, sensor histidine kinase and response regulator
VLKFYIQDTGIGMTPEAQTRLFEAFSQGAVSTTRTYGGTGLGLAIAKKLVEMMHGEIGVQSTAGVGTTFWFTARLEKQASNARSIDRRDLSTARVLVIDDNETNRETLCRQIIVWEMEATSAATGPEALQKLRSAAQQGNPFGLALLDVGMPGMDGLALARAIKSDPLIANTRLVALTALGQSTSEETLKLAGIDSYLIKPVKQSRLFDCLVEPAHQAVVPETVLQTDRFAVAAQSFRADPPPGKPRILLAEDNQINQLIAVGLLLKLGHETDIVTNGLGVLEALKTTPYDIIFMDCQMPEMDGYEAARTIRAQEQSGDRTRGWSLPIYIIAITANAMEGDREKCLAAGMDSYLSKPIRLPELQAAFEHWKAYSQIEAAP